MSFELVCALYRGEMGFSCAIIPKNVAAVQTPHHSEEKKAKAGSFVVMKVKTQTKAFGLISSKLLHNTC